MSLITHPCTVCGHPDIWRTGGTGACSCGCRCVPGASEIRPTFDLASRRVDRITPPGDKLGGHASTPTCSCQGCKALYEQLTAP